MNDNSPVVAIPETVPAQETATTQRAKLTSGRLLVWNAAWNLLGICSPGLVALVCLPMLKRGLGTDRLGIISLAWIFIGYFGLFDLGLSRALTKLVAEKLGQDRPDEIPSLVWTSLFTMGGIGCLAVAAAFLFSHWLVAGPLRIPPELRHETLVSLDWLSFSIPVILMTVGLRGVLEALQRFRLATAIRIPMGIFTYLGPVLVLPFSHSLVPIVATLVFGRCLAGAAHLWACFHAFPPLRTGISFDRASIGPLVRFGGWITVSNIVGPLMVTFDRFLIGTIFSVSAVAYYAVPYEVVFRFSFLAIALAGVLFPAFSTAAESDRGRLIFLYECGVKYLSLALFPATLVLIAFANEGLRLWLGDDFARNSTHVVQLLAIAIFVNSIAQIPFAHVQGAGRPDITAKLHLLELPFYVVALFYFAHKMGITGVAVAWLFRVSLDTALLFVFSWKIMPENRFLLFRLPLMMTTALAAFVYAAWPTGLAIKTTFTAIACIVITYAAWRWMISPREKMAISSSIGFAPALNRIRRKA